MAYSWVEHRVASLSLNYYPSAWLPVTRCLEEICSVYSGWSSINLALWSYCFEWNFVSYIRLLCCMGRSVEFVSLYWAVVCVQCDYRLYKVESVHNLIWLNIYISNKVNVIIVLNINIIIMKQTLIMAGVFLLYKYLPALRWPSNLLRESLSLLNTSWSCLLDILTYRLYFYKFLIIVKLFT